MSLNLSSISTFAEYSYPILGWRTIPSLPSGLSYYTMGSGFDTDPIRFRYISNIQMPGAKVVYASLVPPSPGDMERTSSQDWAVDMDQLQRLVTPHTKMIVLNSPWVF